MSSSLLDPGFVRALERLRVELRRRVEGLRAGEHRSHRRGASVEFAEHRPYAAGDDLRRVDWNAYARLDELVVRLFVAEEDVTLHLLVDASRSMGFGSPTKFAMALRLAAALGYLALTGSERVSVMVGSNGDVRAHPALRGRRGVHALLQRLEALQPEGTAAMERLADRVLSGPTPRSGIAVLLTDAYDSGGSVTAARRLAAARHEVSLVHLLSEEELRPTLDGDSSLEDCESAATLELTVDEETLARYQARLGDWVKELDARCRGGSVRYVRSFAGREPFDVLVEVLTGRSPDVPRSPRWTS